MKVLLSGNEAVARGAYEAGVKVASGYPGTPSTEIIENLAKYEEIYAEWSPNEKVAFEVALGAAIAGARSIVSMKHVGLNVAADPLFSSAYTGVKGGFVIVTCDDPGMHSSQNEQDNRRYAKFAKIPLIEPSDPKEAYEFIKIAFEISEKFEIPVLFRMTTRISHTKGIVEISERKEFGLKEYKKNPSQFLLLPSNARIRHKILEEKLKKIKEFSNETILNKIFEGKSKIGIVTSGISYNYAREVFEDAWILKIGMPFPFPDKILKEFGEKVEEIIAIEENEPFLEEEIKILGFKVKGKEYLPLCDELTPEIVRKAFKNEELPHPDEIQTVKRPPQLCPGCPHTGVFYSLSRLKVTVVGDIGCYTLGALPPFNAMDTCICMGASIGNALGFEKANENFKRKIVAVIGDSTFLHSGIEGLMNVVYNKGSLTVIILDNRTTAMTGHQNHPGTGITVKGEKTKEVNIKDICKAIGVMNVYEINPYDLKETLKTIKSAIESDNPCVVISKAPCALLKESRERFKKEKKKRINEEKCLGEKCKACIRLGCPAISILNGKAYISEMLCVGCGLCLQVCRVGAIYERD
jgi:indolepyruvate ferredoxin oxidoreductase alpha subunit